MIEINLLPPKDLLSKKSRAAQLFWMRLVLLGALATGLVGGGAFGAEKFFEAGFQTSQARNSILTKQFADSETKAIKLINFQRKAEGIMALQGESWKVADSAQTVGEVFQSARLDRVNIIYDGTINVVGTVASLDVMTNLLNVLSLEGKTGHPIGQLGNVRISDLRTEQKGGYGFTVDAIYKKLEASK